MFVVIFLVDAQKHIVVPQKFISGLSQQSLNNYGKKRSTKFKVFWSKKANFDDPTSDCTPNFGLAVSLTFPPEEDEACYYGQIKYFYGE